MSTTAQILANRNNSQKSTGPRTDEGKATVSQNAVKHGLFAAEAVISVEDPADYQLYRDEFLAELLPIGMMESMLAERIVSLAWRLRRAERMQNEVFDDMIERNVTNPSAVESRKDDCYDEGIQPDDPRFASDHLALGRIATRDWANCSTLDRLLLYERRIENSLYKTINRLKQYQVIRQVEKGDANRQQPAPESNNPAGKLDDLKKQSQFAAAHLTTKLCMQGNYDNIPTVGDEENKAKQSQSPAAALTSGAGKRDESLAAATG